MLMLPPSIVYTVPFRDGALEHDVTVDLIQHDLPDESTEVLFDVRGRRIGMVVIDPATADPIAAIERALAVAVPTYRRAETRRRRLLAQ